VRESRHPESVLEMARRHAREGEARVARQAAIVAELEKDHHAEAVALGSQVLETIRAPLDAMRRHLRQIEEQSKS
jgi:hypothetical protein